jgi:hypothetical protein
MPFASIDDEFTRQRLLKILYPGMSPEKSMELVMIQVQLLEMGSN